MSNVKRYTEEIEAMESRMDELDAFTQGDEARDWSKEEADEYAELTRKYKDTSKKLSEAKEIEALRAKNAEKRESYKVGPAPEKRGKEEEELSKKFNFVRAINGYLNGSLDGAEAEMHARGRESLSKCGITASRNSFVIPADELTRQGGMGIQTRANITENSTTGIAKGPIEAALYANTILGDLGATMIMGVEDYRIPLLGTVSTSWEGETDAAADGGAAMSKVDLAPTRLAAYINYSKQAQMQHNNALSSALINDILAAVAAKLEYAVFTDDTSQGGPTDIKDGKTAVTASTITNLLMALEEEVMGNNAYKGNLGYAISHSLYAEVATAAQVGSVNTLLNGMIINGHPVRFTSQAEDVASNQEAAYFGNWADLVIAQFGGIEILEDPYTQAASGMNRLVLNSYWDFALKRGASISVGGFTGTNI